MKHKYLIKKIKNFFINLKKEKRADMFAIGFLLTMMMLFIIAGILSYIMPVFDRQMRLVNFTKALCRQCEIDGTVDQTITENILKEHTGLDPEIIYEYEGYKGTKCVQINEYITVKTKVDYPFVIRHFINSKITLKAKAVGKSEVYYK